MSICILSIHYTSTNTLWFISQISAATGPRFTVNNQICIRMLFVEVYAPVWVILHAECTNQVKSETINVVFGYPVIQRITDHHPYHVVYCIDGVSASWQIVFVIVLAGDIFEYRFIECMVVYNVHNYTNAVFVQFVDHGLNFLNLHVILVCSEYRWVAIFRYIVVPWIITPVVAAVILWIYIRTGCIIVDWLQLNVGYSEFFQMIDTGLNTVVWCTGLYHTEVTAFLIRSNTGGIIDGEVANMNFVYDRIFSVL